ncbi:hypothetical protein [Erythrobacter donghaensis]|uniref:hypothetical protein n=1 Tax=Erythrobacter donghaensis TaxID=267135 RepID=UPI000A37228D|nr:hypothetical protein [Erythrobacter donghaensis]
MPPRLFALAPLPLILSACAPPDPAAEASRTAAAIAAAPEVTVKGPGERCINRSQLRNTVVRSERVIDFEMHGGKVYRNTLRQSCPGLNFDRAIAYETSIDQLCTQQIVYSLQNIGGVPRRGAGCSLGEFVPVEYVRKTEG